MEDHVANSARFSSLIGENASGPKLIQDFREELQRKMEEVDELPEEEQLARLEQLGQEMRNEAKELDKQFENLRKKVEEARSGSVEGGAGARGLDQLTELMAGLGMGGGAVRSSKAAEAKTAQGGERSSSIPSLEDLERMMKDPFEDGAEEKKRKLEEERKAILPRKVVGAFRHEVSSRKEDEQSEEAVLRGVGPSKRVPGMSRKEQKEAAEAAERMLVDAMVQMELRKYVEKMAEAARRRRERMGEDPGSMNG